MEDALNNFLFVFELMGLQYFSLVNDNLKDRPTALRTAFMFVIITLISTLLLCYFSFVPLKEEIITSKTVLNFAIKHSMGVGLLLVVYTSIIQSYISTRSIKKVYLNTKEIVRIVYREFNVPVDFNLIKRAARKSILLMSLFLVTVHIVLAIKTVKSLLNAIDSVFSLFAVFFLLVIVYKFVFYVAMVNSQLLLMRDLLRGVFKNFITKPNFTTSSEIARLTEDPLKQFRAARRIYNLIYENASLINSSNGLTILILLISIVITLTASGYEIFISIVGNIPETQISSKFEKAISDDCL